MDVSGEAENGKRLMISGDALTQPAAPCAVIFLDSNRERNFGGFPAHACCQCAPGDWKDRQMTSHCVARAASQMFSESTHQALMADQFCTRFDSASKSI
jgi:hypothetical protein